MSDSTNDQQPVLPPPKPSRGSETSPPPKPKRSSGTTPPPRPQRGAPSSSKGSQRAVWKRRLFIGGIGLLCLLVLVIGVGLVLGLRGPSSTTAADYRSAEVREIIRLLREDPECRDTRIGDHFYEHNNSLELWDRVLGKPAAVVGPEDSPDWTFIAAGEETARLQGVNGDVRDVEFAPHTRQILALTHETVFVWDDPAESSPRELAIPPRHHPFDDTEYSPDGRLIVVGDRGGAATIFDAQSGEQLLRIEAHQRSTPDQNILVHDLAITADGQVLATASFDHTVGLWNMEDGSRIGGFDGHSNPVACVAFSPDGRQALSGAWGGEVFLWSVATGETVHKLEGHTDERAYAAAFVPDGRRAVTGSATADDGFVILWDVESGSEITRFPEQPAQVRDIAVSPDGRFFVTAATDGSVRLFRLPSASASSNDRSSTEAPHRPAPEPLEARPLSMPVIRPLTSLNTDRREQGLWASLDGRRIYFEREGSPTRVHIAQRSSIGEPFSNVRPLVPGRHPTLSGDERILIVLGPRSDGDGESLHEARRDDLAQPFPESKEIAELRHELRPKTPYLTPDGLSLVYLSIRGTQRQFVISQRSSLDERWQAPQPLPMEDIPGARLSWPFLSADGLVLIAADESEQGEGRFLVWTRPDRQSRFTNPQPITVPGEDLFGRSPHYVEPTNELAFSSTRPRRFPSYLDQQREGEWDLWIVEGFSLP